MPVIRYRSVEDMPRPWRSPDDPENLRLVAQMLTFYRSLTPDDHLQRTRDGLVLHGKGTRRAIAMRTRK